MPIVALIPGRAGDCRLPRASASHANVIARASASVVARRSVSFRGVRALACSWVTRSSQMALVLRLANHPEALVHLAGIRTAIVVDRVSIVAFFAPTNAESDCMAGIGVPADGAQVGPVEVGGLIPQHLLLPRSRRTCADCRPRQLARALDAHRKRTILGPSQKLRVRYFDGSDSRLAVTGVGQRNARDFNVVDCVPSAARACVYFGVDASACFSASFLGSVSRPRSYMLRAFGFSPAWRCKLPSSR